MMEPIPAVAVAPPAWIREHLLPSLGLPSHVPLHFIGEKTLTASDVKPQQNRFFILKDGVRRNLLPLLSSDELAAANLAEEGGRAAVKGPPVEGLSVSVSAQSGAGVGSSELKLKRWGASNGTIINGEGCSAFFRGCGFRPNDAVEIWAFRRSPCVRLFGVDLQPAVGPMHIVIAKRDDQRWQPPAALPQPAPLSVHGDVTVHEH